jgi:hypothetical protein
MRLIFRPWTNTFARVSLVIGMTTPLLVILGLMLWVRSTYFTQAQHEVVQPVQFDHRHHVADIGIDCRYCHQSVEKAASAGYPPTQLCLNCHSQVWNKSPLLDIVRQSYFSNEPIPWQRVHRLPDFVYFNHSIHVNKGIGCETCHGRVDEMPAILETGGEVSRVDGDAPLTMGWCLGCHRDPQKFVRPKDQITTMGYRRDQDPGAKMVLADFKQQHPDMKDASLGAALIHQNAVRTRVSCTACHR